MPTKVIVVIGATGNQGTSVAETFLGLSTWHVRAITRNPSSDAAQKLRTKGAEIVQADLADVASLEAAMAGAHAVFLNTDYWEVYRPMRAALAAEGKDIEPASHAAYQNETRNGRNAADAAARVPTLERFVVSSLGSASKGSGGKYPRSLHTESKAWTVEYVGNEHPELAAKMSIIFLGAYNTNPFLVPKLNPQTGKYAFVLPWKSDTRMPTIDPSMSTGPFVRALVEDEAPGTKLLAYDSDVTAAEMIQAWSRASGKDAELGFITTQEMHDKMGVGWDHLDAINSFLEFGYCSAVEGLITPSQLKSKIETRSLEEWLQARDWDKVLSG